MARGRMRAMRPGPEFRQQRPSTTVRVLFLEHDAALAAGVCKHLDRAGAALPEHQHARSLREALDQLGRADFDVVIASLELPDSAGLETVDRLRGAGAALILAVAENGDDALREQAIARGAYD